MSEPVAVEALDARRTYRRVLSLRNTRFLLLADVLSKFGDWFVFLAGNMIVFDLGGLGAIAVFNGLRFAVPVLVTPYAGRVGMRWPPVAVMVVSDLVRAALYGLLAVAAFAEPNVWLLVGLWTISFVSGAAFVPAEKRLYRCLVDADDLAALHAVGAIVGSTALLVAPLLGAAVAAVFSPEWLLAVNALSFVASAALLGKIQLRTQASVADSVDSRRRDSVRAALSGVFTARSQISNVFGLLVCDAFLAGSVFGLLVPVTASLTSIDSAPGVFLACIGVGTIAGAWVGGRLAPHLDDRLAAAVALLGAVSTAALAAPQSLAALGVLGVVLGFVSNAIDPYIWSQLQTRIPQRSAGAFWGVVDAGFTAALVGGSAFSAFVAAEFGLNWAPPISAVTAIALGFTVAAAGAGVRARTRAA